MDKQESKERPVLVTEEEEKIIKKEAENGSIFSTSETPAILEDEIMRVEKNIELWKRISSLSLKMTIPSDWVLQDGQPYLMEGGAQKIANLWGIDISSKETTEEWHDDTKGKYYVFIVKGSAYSRKINRYLEDEGTCSQRDKFFGMAGGALKKLEDVDKTLIRKKANTNLNNRLIKKMAGIAGITIDDLKEAGLDVEKIPSFEYKKDTQKTRAKLSKSALEMRDELWKWCLEMAAGAEEAASAILKEKSYFKTDDNKEFSVKQIDGLKSEGWIKATHGRVKEDYEKAFGKVSD